MGRIEHLKRQIELGEIHNDMAYVRQCEKELRQLDKCYGCQYYTAQAVASVGGDGYGHTEGYCDPPMGECPLDQ